MGILRLIFGTTIVVTQEDIDKGEQGIATKCALAYAIQREVDKKYGKVILKNSNSFQNGQEFSKRQVWVSGYGGLHVGFYKESGTYAYGSWALPSFLPKVAKKFVKFFDQKKEVKPFQFKLII
jgi:hypothetical protein